MEEFVEIDFVILIEIRFVEILIDTIGQYAIGSLLVREECSEKTLEIFARPCALSDQNESVVKQRGTHVTRTLTCENQNIGSNVEILRE